MLYQSEIPKNKKKNHRILGTIITTLAFCGFVVHMAMAHVPKLEKSLDATKTEIINIASEYDAEHDMSQDVETESDFFSETTNDEQLGLGEDKPFKMLQVDFNAVERNIIRGAVKRGDSTARILDDYLTNKQIAQLVTETNPTFKLRKIMPGNTYAVFIKGGEFEKFEYDIGKDKMLIVEATDGGFKAKTDVIKYHYEQSFLSGTIETTLGHAVSKAGGSTFITSTLTDIFGWDIDFLRDVRKGDQFAVIVEKKFREGEDDGYGKITAAEFTNNGEKHKAFLYQDGTNPPDYYDEDGKSLRKAFLKSPVNYSRISSGYSNKRFHPITKTWKAHPAIDYAAPPGTPIKTVGDGYISRIGRTKGNGNFIEVTHKNGYKSLYLHMRRFAKNMKKYKRIQQGDVIGYVGSTGLATGPHLCFRMKRHEKPVNPTKIKATAAAPVSKSNIANYKSYIQPLQASINNHYNARFYTATADNMPAIMNKM